jgi:hypothetical protein
MSRRYASFISVLLLLPLLPPMLTGCQTQLKFEPKEPRPVSEIVWDDYDHDGRDEPRQTEGVEYGWRVEER